MNFQQFIDRLSTRLEQELPGYEAQIKMAPSGRKTKQKWPSSKRQTKSAGVLVLFYPKAEIPHLVFIKRPAYLGVHSKQISFPGGRQEMGDDNLTVTAFREAHEELGISKEEVQRLGKLTPLYIPPSRYWVQPIVGVAHHTPHFKPDEREVAEVLEVPVKRFFDSEIQMFRSVSSSRPKKQKRKVPCYFIGGETIWGATAMMLSELVEVLSGIPRIEDL